MDESGFVHSQAIVTCASTRWRSQVLSRLGPAARTGATDAGGGDARRTWAGFTDGGRTAFRPLCELMTKRFQVLGQQLQAHDSEWLDQLSEALVHRLASLSTDGLEQCAKRTAP